MNNLEASSFEYSDNTPQNIEVDGVLYPLSHVIHLGAALGVMKEDVSGEEASVEGTTTIQVEEMYLRQITNEYTIYKSFTIRGWGKLEIFNSGKFDAAYFYRNPELPDALLDHLSIAARLQLEGSDEDSQWASLLTPARTYSLDEINRAIDSLLVEDLYHSLR